MRAVRVVHVRQIWPDFRLFGTGVGLGAAALASVWLLAVLASLRLGGFPANVTWMPIIETFVFLMLLVCALGPLGGLLVRRGWQVLSLWRAMILGSGYATGISLAALALVLARIFHEWMRRR